MNASSSTRCRATLLSTVTSVTSTYITCFTALPAELSSAPAAGPSSGADPLCQWSGLAGCAPPPAPPSVLRSPACELAGVADVAAVPPSVDGCVVLGPLGSEPGEVPEATGGVAASAVLSHVVTLWHRCNVAARASRDCGVARTRRFVRFLQSERSVTRAHVRAWHKASQSGTAATVLYEQGLLTSAAWRAWRRRCPVSR